MRAAWQLLETLGKTLDLPRVAAGDVHMHRRSRRALQDVLTAIRLNTPAERRRVMALFPNGERCLRPLQRLRELYPAPLLAANARDRRALHVHARRAALRISRRDRARGRNADESSARADGTRLRQALAGGRAAGPCATRIEHELRLIAELNFEPFFLTVHDVVQYARSQKILCQGRGSAANSVVCYCLQITEVDPVAHGHAVRALHLQGTQRAAGHRRGFRARAARRGDPIHLRQIRPRARRARRHRHLLPAAQRAARCGQGVRTDPGGSRQAGARHAVVGRSAHRSASTSAPPDSIRTIRANTAAHGAHGADPGLPAPPIAARGRLRHRARPPG